MLVLIINNMQSFRAKWSKKLSLNNPTLFLDILKIRREKQQDSIIIVVGQKRTSKSWSSITLAELIDPNFDVENGLFFEPSAFLKSFNENERKVYIFDEGSESYDRRTWYGIQNAVFNSLLTREGFRQNILIMTLPVLSDLDQRAVRLSTFLITMKGFNTDTCKSFGIAYRLFLMDLLGKTRPTAIQNLFFRMPSKENIEKYEKMKREWNDRKSTDNIKLLEQLEDPELYQKGLAFKEYISLLKNGVIDNDYFLKRGEKLNYNKTDLYNIIALIEKEKAEPKEDNIVKETLLKTVEQKDGSLETRIYS